MNRFSTAVSAFALACAMVAPAAAQESDAEQPADDGIGLIIVTAQKRAENVQDVPIAITAVGSQFLETRGIASIDDLGTIAPNVKFERAPASKTISQIAIRGSPVSPRRSFFPMTSTPDVPQPPH